MRSTSAQTDGRVVSSIHDGVGTITLSRPDKRNALTFRMWTAIPAALAALAHEPGLRYVVLQGEGEHFSAGADLQEVHAACHDMADARRFCRAITEALYGIATCAWPVVAAVRGQAIGGALELALAADFRVAAVGARMQLPFVTLGMVPDPLTLKRLVALVGDAKSRALLLAADMLTDRRCLELGLVEQLVPAGDMEAVIGTLMAPYRQSSSYVLGRSKALLAGIEGADLQAVAEYRAQSFVYGGVRDAAAKFLARRATTAPRC